MGRYRPPQPRAMPYISREGFIQLEAELKALWQRRREVTRALAAAAAEGDRSENAEYIYRKKELRSIDYRIRYLQKRLPELVIVDNVPDNLQQIFFGAHVLLESEDGRQVRYRIVGADETDRQKHYISMDSPMAQALMKKQLDDEVLVRTPEGEKRYFVVDVKYEIQDQGNAD